MYCSAAYLFAIFVFRCLHVTYILWRLCYFLWIYSHLPEQFYFRHGKFQVSLFIIHIDSWFTKNNSKIWEYLVRLRPLPILILCKVKSRINLNTTAQEIKQDDSKYNQGDNKVSQTNEAVVGGREDPHGSNFTDRKISYLIISISKIW